MPTLFMLDCRRADSQVALQRARTLVMIPHEKHLYLRHYHATGGWPCCAAPQGRYRAMLVPSVDVLSIDACPPSARAKSVPAGARTEAGLESPSRNGLGHAVTRV